MTTQSPVKQKVESYNKMQVLWCSKCLKDLSPDKVWVSDDRRDGRLLCFDCAPDDAIRVKDLI